MAVLSRGVIDVQPKDLRALGTEICLMALGPLY